MNGRTWLEPQRPRKMRYALEVRHESFRDVEFVALLRHHGVALVVADTAGRWPIMEDVTADFVYVRLHGDEALYTSGYGRTALLDWAKRITAWRRGGVDRKSMMRAWPRRLCRQSDCGATSSATSTTTSRCMRLSTPCALPRSLAISRRRHSRNPPLRDLASTCCGAAHRPQLLPAFRPEVTCSIQSFAPCWSTSTAR